MKAKVFYAAETKLFNAIFTDENQQVKTEMQIGCCQF